MRRSRFCWRSGERFSWRFQVLLAKLRAIVTPDIESTAAQARTAVQNAAATAGRSRSSAPSGRRVASAVLAGLAVVGFSVAVVAPAGLALSAAEPAQASVTTAYSLAARDAQNITVSVNGATPTAQTRDAFEVYVTPKPTPTPTPTPEPVTASEDESSSDSSGSSGGVGPMYYSGGGEPAQWMAAAGIASSDWGYVDYIVSRESSWNPNATNSSSGACGLVQALPCSKVPGNGYDPVDNLRWASGYAVGRYGSWAAAVDFWASNHWW